MAKSPKKKPAKAVKKAAAKKSAKPKVAPKKAAKAKPKSKRALPAPPAENKKAVSREVSTTTRGLETALNGIDIDITFKLGLGQLTVTHFQNGNTIDEKTITKTGSIHFDDVLPNDAISINGACSGTCTLVTNRQTDPLSDSSQPRSYASGSIFDNLVVEQ